MDEEPPADEQDDGEYTCGPCQSGKHGSSCRDWACACCAGEGRLLSGLPLCEAVRYATMSDAFKPGATGKRDGQHVEINGTRYTVTEAEALGFVPGRTDVFAGEWVLPDAFQVRGVFERGDMQFHDIEELGALVSQWFAERGVRMVAPGIPEAFCYSTCPAVPTA